MFRYVVPAALCLITVCIHALAQESQNRPAPPSDMEGTMEDARPGDRWTYERRDEIKGEERETRTVVTEVAASTITLRVDPGTNNQEDYTYDRSWNLITGRGWKFTPNDGTGVRLPLVSGTSWSFQSDYVNSNQNISNKRSGTSNAIRWVAITTRAGTFDAVEIQTSFSDYAARGPVKKFDCTLQTWYAPAINHWVKRVVTVQADGKPLQNISAELIEFGRK